MNKKNVCLFLILTAIIGVFTFSKVLLNPRPSPEEFIKDFTSFRDLFKQTSVMDSPQEVMSSLGVPKKVLYFYMQEDLSEKALHQEIRKRLFKQQYKSVEVKSADQVMKIIETNEGRCFTLWLYDTEALTGFKGTIELHLLNKTKMAISAQFRSIQNSSLEEFELIKQTALPSTWEALFAQGVPDEISISEEVKNGVVVSVQYKSNSDEERIKTIFWTGDINEPKEYLPLM